MCGIAGLIGLDGDEVDPAVLRSMAQTLEHRGPDDHGLWIGENRDRGVGLAHTRLSIIDLAGSVQPMTSPDGRYVITFNGEILNYRELRSGLDHPFRTAGDTEVLLAAFVAHGPEAFDLLAGQFACAVLDRSSGELWLARDRMGILPLYWWSDGSTFAFGSEVKALAPVIGPLAVDPEGLQEYLTRRAVPAPGTLYAGVKKLPPGHRMVVRTGSGPGPAQAYWRPGAVAGLGTTDPDQAVDQVDAALVRAVGRNLVADVPVGCYLSGGVDSSLITAMTVAARGGSTKTETFSAGFGDPRFDELGFAELVADRLGTVHHPVAVRESDFQELWPSLTRFRDAPLSEPADVAVYRLAQTARQHVKVVLSGEGSDELFAGYPKHAFARASAGLAAIPPGWRAPVLTAVERRLPASAHRLRIAVRALSGRSETDLFQGWFAPFTAAERARSDRSPTGVPPQPRCRR